MDERLFWIAFSHVKGIGAARFKSLIDFFNSAQAAWEAPALKLQQSGLPENVLDNLLKARVEMDINKIWQDLQNSGIQVLTWLDEFYPRRLRDIFNSPPVLYCTGELSPKDDWAVAVVGTRRITPYGKRVVKETVDFLARQGITIVSGLARGVDTEAHQAALEANGRTIAVMGCGVDTIYPPENRSLADQVIQSGAIISDYPPGTPPESRNFPPRNRIISGLSLATLVVEAGERSGALITAKFALDQGREVFAVPGQIFAQHSKGTNTLIQEGAIPMLVPSDLMEALNLQFVVDQQETRLNVPGDETEAKIFALLNDESKHVDEIHLQTGMTVAQVSSTLALMELKGMVYQTGPMKYLAIKEISKTRYHTSE